MNVKAVLVSFNLENDEKVYQSSGILFDENTVLLTGACFIPLFQQKEWISSFVKSSSSEPGTNEYIEKVIFRVLVDKCTKQFHSLESNAICVWKCPLVSESLEKLFYADWTFGHMNLENESGVLSRDDIDLSKELMSIFVLLKCGVKLERINKSDNHIRVLFKLALNVQKPSRGQAVEVVSTPFGNEYFMNSLSCGIISNVVGCENCIILTDARAVSGCEGGPIFVSQRSRKQETPKLIGLVTSPLCWCRGEWVGLTIGVSLLPVLKRLLTTGNENGCSECIEDVTHNSGASINYKTYPSERTSGPFVIDNLITFKDLSPVNFIDETVVLVRSATSWGSGVILNAVSGIIISCSHVVKNDKIVSVFQKGNQYFADVVFKSQDDVAYDLAILKVKDNFLFLNEVSFSKNPPKIGESVIALGFPFFSERDDICIRPTIVTGCIARVNSHMIQTTCCVQAGFSGGAILRDGELLGIIISNARDSTAGALFPHINFIVPSSVFKKPVLEYIKMNDVQCLRDLECSDVMVQTLWKLKTSKL